MFLVCPGIRLRCTASNSFWKQVKYNSYISEWKVRKETMSQVKEPQKNTTEKGPGSGFGWDVNISPSCVLFLDCHGNETHWSAIQ